MGQAQSGPQGPQGLQGLQGPRGDIGPQGQTGEKGKDASGDPTQVATLLSADISFVNKVAPLIAKDNAIGTTVAEQVAAGEIPRSLLTNALLTNKNFSDKLINSMATDTRFRGIQGPAGSAFDELSIQSALEPKSMWCADGQMCRIPTSAPGTYLTGDTVIQRNKFIYLGGASLTTSGTLSVDNKHGIVVKDNNPVDGPFLYGDVGGQIGTFSQVNSTTGAFSLAWGKDPFDTKNTNTNNVYVSNNLNVRGNELALGYSNTAQGDSGASRALVKHNGNTLKINFEGDFAGGTSVDGTQLDVSSGKLKLGKWTIDGSNENNLIIRNKDNQDAVYINKEGGIQSLGGEFIVGKAGDASTGWNPDGVYKIKRVPNNASGELQIQRNDVQANGADSWNSKVSISGAGHVKARELKVDSWTIKDNGKLTFQKDGKPNVPFAVGDEHESNIWIGNNTGDYRLFSQGGNLKFDKFGTGQRVAIDGNQALGWVIGSGRRYNIGGSKGTIDYSD